MANYNSNKRKLYDALSKDYDMGTYEQFCSDLNDEKKRRKLFDATSKEYDLGTYDSFNSQLGYYQQAVEPAKAPTAQPTAKEEAPKAQTTAQPKRQQYFKLRRGGQDFTVSTDEVNAAGGLGGWAKAHPGAPIRTYMHGEGFGGHVDLSQAHNRLNTKGYKYTLVDKPIEQKAQEPWNPTEQEKIRMSAQIEQIRRRGEESMRRTQQQIADFQEYQKKSRGRFGQAVESTPTFNPETGKLEKTYLTPTGDRVNSKAVADAAAYSFRRAYEAADMSVGAQIRRGEAELADLKKQLEGSTSRVHKEWAEDYEKDKAPLAAVLYSQTYVPRQQGDKENAALRAAIRQKEEMLKDLYEERDRQMGKDVGFWRGFGRVAGDIRTWDFGVGDLTDAMTMMNHQQYTSPNATEGEKKAGQAMMKAAYDRQQVEQMYGGNASFWNRAGVMTGYMPSFMVDFALTGGGFEAIEAAGKLATRGAAKVFTKEALKEMSELGLKAYVKKYGAKGAAQYAGNWTIKALGTTADELLIRAPLMTNTVQGLDTAADIINRKLGNVVIDANGNYDYANDKTWGSAVWQAEANSIIENFSEMFGTHLDGALPAIANALGGKRISGMLARANASSYGQILATTRKQFERLGVSDYFGEVAEEYYGQLWRTMLNLDDAYTQEPVFDKDGNPVLDAEGNQVYERKNLLATGQFHGDIWGGMALSMGLMGAGKYTISAAAYGAMKHDVNKADSRASSILTAERWEPMRTIIDNTSNDDMGALAEQVVNDQNMTDEERAAVMEYMERSMNLRGYNLGQMAQSRGADDVETPDPMEDFNQSWLDGYNARSPQEMADAQNQYEYQLSQLQYLLEADQIEALDTNPVNELQAMLQSGLYDDSVIDAARDYINAKFVRDGIMQAVADNTDELVEASNATIRARINNTSGMIQPATMKADDRPVYIVGGNIVANPDGTIDHQASDESVVIRDAATGAIEFTDPRSIFKLDEAVDPQAEMDETERAISEQADRSLNDSLNGTLQFNPGDVYSFPTQDGTIEEWTLIGPALDENMVPIQGQYIMQTSDGQQYTYNGEDIQYFSDQANIARLSQFEQERARARAEADVTDQEESRPKYALNDEFSLRIPDTGQVVRGSVTAEENEDGLVEIYTEDAVGGNKVHMYTPEQLNAMVETYNGQPWAGPKADESVQNSEESVPKTPKNGSIFEETEQNGTETVHEPPERVQQSALERVPVDANGNPMFEEVDADTAWDAIVEQTQGDEEIAAEVVADIIAEKKTDLDAAEKALKKTQEAKPDKRKPGDPVPTMAERIAIKTVSKQALAEATEIRDTAKAILDHWTKIAETTMRRKQEAEAARLAQEAIERKKRAEEAAAAKAAQEEADRIEREALNGVPDWNVDTPTDARARGYRRYGPKKVDRQAPINNKVEGKEVEVKFGDDVMPKGRQVVIDASELQPSHRDGQRNPAHFLDEAQPKERKDAASRFAADKIAANIRPEEVTSAVTAYTGAPTINARGEVIQGNNRSEALRIMYEKYADSAAKYKQYLIDHAAEFGMTPEQIAQIEQPVLTTMLDVSDEDAITYGQYVAQDTESGGIERIKPKNAVKKMGEDIRTFANLLLRSSDDEASFAQLVDANGIEVLKWMSQKGYITDTQYQSAFDSKGNLNAEASNDLKGIMYQSIFTGGTTRLEEMFNNLPAKAQRAILATAYRDHDSAFGERMITEIQQSIIAYNAIMSYESFVNAKNYKDALLAVESWKHQYAFDDVSGESYLPAEAFSNFALTLVAAYKGRTQRDIQSTFNAMYDIVQGTVQPTLFDPNPDTTPKPLAEAIKSVLEIDYQPVVKQTNNDNGTNGSDNVDGSPEESEEGRPGSAGTTDYAERSEETAESPDGGAGAAGDSRAAGDGRNAVGQSDISPTSEAEEISYQLSDEVDEYGKPFVLAKDGSTTFGTIDSDSGLTEAPIRLSLGENTTDDNGANHGYGLLHIEAGHGDQIRNAGYASVEEFVEEVAKNYTDIREGALIGDNQTYLLEVSDEHNNTLFIQLSKDGTYWNVNSAGIFKKKYSRRKPKVYSVPAVGDGISTDTTEVNSGQSKGATAPAGNSSQTSEDKVTTSSEEKQADERESSVGARVAAAEAEVDTNPTDAQKEAGNYKKGHVQVGTFDVSIENPAGSVRRGVDADGKAWATTMHNTYGYIRGTVGVDGDQIDVYLSDHIDGWNGARVFVIDVYNPDGTFDEHKVMLGFNDKEDALFDFTANYDIDWVKARRIEVHSVLMDDFEKWVESSKRKTKPFGEYTIAKKSAEGRSLDGLNQRLEEIEQSVYDDTVRQIEEAVGKPGAIPNIKRMKAHIAELGKQIKALERGLPYVQSDADLVKIQENVARVAGEQKAYKAKLAEFEAKIAEVEKQAEGTTADTDNGYTIDEYTTKSGKKYQRVVLPRVDKTVWQQRLNLAKKMGGISVPKGYGFKTWEEAEAFAQAVISPDTVANTQPLSLDDMRQAVEEAPAAPTTEAEQQLVQQPEAEKPVNPSGNRLVTDERYAQLRERMRRKLGGQLNMGIDPEILAIGTEMAVYHIEKGVRRFTEYAKAMIADLGDAIRPYLKSFYNAVRDMPEAQSIGLVDEMDAYDDVSRVDIAKFDKTSTDAMATAAAVVAEHEAESQRAEAEEKLKEKRKKRRESESKPTIDGGLFDNAEADAAPALAVPEQRPAEELAGDSAAFQERAVQTSQLVGQIGSEISARASAMKQDPGNVKPLTMTEVKKMAAQYPSLKDISDTDLQELVELAMTQLTRAVALSNVGGTAEQQRAAFDHVVSLYQMQPSLNARDSERLIKQQYSTPTPFGYVMGQFVRAGGKTVESMLEPSAGNGALTITVDPSHVHVNDIDEARLANLRKLGYGQVTAQDALLPFGGDMVDVVMTNPPFGTVTEKIYDGVFRVSSLEGQMAINALERMKDDGRAAIVIGGNTSYRTNGSMNPKDAAFFGYLYSHYNVTDVINISGKALYSRNGTGYDVRMILIDGRKTGDFQRVYPPVKAKARAEQITTFDELYKRVQDDIQQIQQVGRESADVQRQPGTAADGEQGAPVRGGSNRTDAGTGQRSGEAGHAVGDTPRTDSGRPAPGNVGSRPARVDNADGRNATGADDVPRPEPRQPRSVGSTGAQDVARRSGGDGRGAAASRPDTGAERLAVKPDLTTEKVPYPNQSGNGFTLMSVVPAAQAQVLQRSLAEIGDVDQFLVDELGYSSKDELYGYLAAEQIDSVALAIHQMNNGNAFIIGDMTGVGKGRQGAALIRYAVKQGKVPIYFTQKPTLFTDNYHDLADIGSSDLRPFIIASNPKDANIVDADGNVVHRLPSKKEQERVFAYIMEHGTLPEEYDYVLTTYDQIKNGTADYQQGADGQWSVGSRKLSRNSKGYTTADHNGQARRDALAEIAKGNIAILDESHTVGGDSGCGRYMQMLTSQADGVTFLSATFAKRADNMPIYAQRTAIAEAGIKAGELIEAIAKGGVTLQEIMSKQLVESGQMIRRERSFEGVTIDWLNVEEETDRRQRAQFNEVADIFNAIRSFQNDYITPLIDSMNEQAAETGGTVGHTQGTKDMGVKNVPFASKMYNLVNQLLFALKVDAVADRVIENLRNVYKPVISCTNTMEGFLSEAPKGEVMDEIPDFSITLMRALDGVMRFTEKDADENSEGGRISLGQLPTEGQAAYNAIRAKIENLSAGLPISPMDAIRMKIEAAGYSVAEITGRTVQLNRTEDGRYIVETRKDRDKKAAMRDFNSGRLDVLMINKSGSTGISLHASSKFDDQRPRVMVFAQFQSDINDEVQMRGRIDRSGQVTRGRYEYIMSTIPAEQRIQMMFKAKLKSLDANTTSSQKSKFNEMEIVDYLNKYGDEVVWEYMKEHPELSERLGDPLDMLQEGKSEDGPRTSEKEDTSKKNGCAGKISRYLAFLSVEEQDEIFREITEAYRVKMQLLDDAGENDLEITTMPLRAETRKKQIWNAGANPGSGNAFADNTYVEEVEVDVLRKPMKRDEIAEATRRLMGEHYAEKNGGVDWQHYVRAKGDEITAFIQAKAEEAVGKLKAAGEARIAKARERAVAAATKARSKGENNFTDAEIQSLADAVAGEARQKEEQKQLKRQEEIMAVKNRILGYLNRLRAEAIYVVPQDLKQGTAEMFSQTFGTFVGFKFNKTFTLGSSTAIFATLDGRRKVELALSDKAINTIINATDIAYRYSPKEIGAISMENWDEKVPTQTRQRRYIITGNLLQALVDTEKGDKTRGNLISFSTIDGETRQGILMGENFKLTDLRNSVPLSSRLAQIRDGVAVSSENGDVEIERIGYGWQHRGDFELRVPKSKQRGGVYTMNHGLLKHIDGNNFVSKGNHMIGYISPENLAKVLDMLSHEPFNVTVLQKSKLAEVKDEDLLLREGEETESTDIKAVNERFNRELQQQAEGTLPVGHIYQIGHPGAILRAAGFPDMPIELSSTRLSEKAAQENHIFDIEEVRNLVKEMNTPWAVFRYGNNAKNVIIGIEHNDKQFLVGVHFNQNRGGMEVSSIRGIFPKDHAEWLNWISQGKAEYLNKEKIQTLIDQQRINLADVAYLDLDDVAKVINSFENPTIEGEESLGRQGDGYGAYSDEEVSYANDPTSKLLGKNRFSKKRQAEFAARERQRMADRVQELAERMNLDNVEIVTDASQLEGKRAKAKGFYNKRSGKITIVIPNNVSTIDAEQTLLHEAVAHYGLRQLFGAQFETFLDNVYESADPAIRRKIAEMAAKNGWDFRTATEEYLAGLAEDTDFNEARSYGGWWSQIKRLFLNMLEKIGFAGFRDKAGVILSDNELRYILWRSYQNIAEPGRYRSILGEASDVAKQSQLKVGNYAEHGIEADYAAEGDGLLDEISLKFDQELEAYENRQLPTGHRFELGMPSRYLRSAGFPNLPISMRSSLLARKAGDERHPFEASDLKGLVDAIQRPIAIFEYTKPNMRNLIVDLRRGDKHFLVGVTLNYKAGEVEINSVSGLFPKESHEWVKWIQDGKAIRIDQKEKVQAIIDSLRTNPAESERIGLNLDGAAKIVNSFENPTVEEEGLFRPGDFSPRDRALIRHKYEEMVRSGGYQFKEAVQDSMLGLKKLYQAILGRSTRIEDVPGFENAYLFENRMSSMNAGEQHEYFRRYMQPLLQEIGRIVEANSRKRRELTDYIMAKHGLERNEYMRAEAAKNGEDTDRDFAGLMGLTGEADWRAAEATAQQWVDDYESMHDTAALWEAVNKATKATLEKVYLAGIISKETYEKILDMYEYYVPLRGWNETTSEEVYGYLTSKDGPLGGSIMKKAEGRSSMADDPIATIGMMADDAIRQGNRNLMKQRFLNFVLNHPSDAVSVHDIWLEYDDVADEWRPVFADVEATDTADEVAQKVEDFEQRMEELRKDHPDKYKKGREAQNIPYKVVRGNLREHQILIKKNGRTFVATINGNPRAAQALNGLTNPDVDQNGVVGNMLKAGTWINRQLSAFYTTRNPDFVVSNFFRDMLYSNCMTWVKESPRYALRFHKNFGRVNPAVMRRLLGKWENGTPDMNNRLESLFYQFMRNGGETGYTNVRDIEGHKRTVAKELKKQGSAGRRAWAALGMQLDLLNRSVENCARFAAFITSRDFGRSIDRAIYDAKEISVNFNKKGSGGKMVNAVGQKKLGKFGSYLGGGGRIAYVFWNAGIQGMTNALRQGKRHPYKFTAGASALFALGYVIPLLAQMLGGGDGDDDDKNAYYNLPEYVRRSNICFRAGGQWITIPLPIEYRAMYGMGELCCGTVTGNERYSDKELTRQMLAQFSQLFPLDMLEGGGGVSPLIPSALKPYTEAYIMNKGWTGLPVYKDTPFNKNAPEWTKAYASADQHLVDFTRWLNETTGGDQFTKGAIDINPAKIEYLLNGTFGGLFTFPNKIKKTGETMFGDREFDWRSIPIANRLIKTGDERTANRKLQNEYFKYKEEYEQTQGRLRNYESEADKGDDAMQDKADLLFNSPQGMRYQIFDEFKADLDAYREDIAAETDKEMRAQLEAEMYQLMRELVNALHDPETYINQSAQQ